MKAVKEPWYKLLLHPCFDFGINMPCPYIWFAYWLITWDSDCGKIDIKSIRINFMPD